MLKCTSQGQGLQNLLRRNHSPRPACCVNRALLIVVKNCVNTSSLHHSNTFPIAVNVVFVNASPTKLNYGANPSSPQWKRLATNNILISLCMYKPFTVPHEAFSRLEVNDHRCVTCFTYLPKVTISKNVPNPNQMQLT